VKLPSLDVYDSQYKNNIAVIDRQSLVLDKIAQQAKNESVIYEDLADKLYNEIQRNDLTFAASGLSVWSYQYWMYTLTTDVVVFICIRFVFLYNKLRIVIAALTLLNNVASAMAQRASESITPMILDFFRSKTEVPTDKYFAVHAHNKFIVGTVRHYNHNHCIRFLVVSWHKNISSSTRITYFHRLFTDNIASNFFNYNTHQIFMILMLPSLYRLFQWQVYGSPLSLYSGRRFI
jgi:hypothetical protein